MPSRILGMADVVSLVERAAERVDEDEAKRMEKNAQGLFTLEDSRTIAPDEKTRLAGEHPWACLPGGADMMKGATSASPKRNSCI